MKRFLKFISALSVFCLLSSLLPIGVFATDTSGTYGEGVEWTLSSMGTLTISGTGAMADREDEEEAPWGTDIREVIVRDGITSIGRYAFADQPKLYAVYLPESVDLIDFCAFYNCSSLKSITMPEALETLGEFAFTLCTSLEKISVPDGIEEIGMYTFSKCTALRSIKIPDSAKAIRRAAFFKCEALRYVTFGDALEIIEESAFWGCDMEALSFGNNLKTIGKNAFIECYSLYSVDFPDSLLEIGKSAFYDCTSLKNVSVPESVEKIDSSAFGYRFVTAQGIRKVDGFSMDVVEGSAAHTYALENSFRFTFVEGKKKLPEADKDEYMNEEGVMPNVKEKTSASALISNLAEYGIEAKIFDKDNNLLSDGSRIGTGCVVSISDGREYTVSVKGDVDGTGVIDSTDYLKIKSVFLGGEVLEGVYFSAADADENDEINSTDYLRIKSYLLGDMDLYA